MDETNAVTWMTEAIGKATRSAKFCVSGQLPGIDPGIEVDGYGLVKLPLRPKAAKELIAHGRVAPYGKGTKTLVDTKVRNTFELDPKKLQLSTQWDIAIADATRNVAEELGLPADRLEARLYKLLVYQRGGFFLPHRDSEKLKGMVASLIVVLPGAFDGGALVVHHESAKRQRFLFDDAASGQRPDYAAFYADCEHEVERVTTGVRVCLAYNLVLRAARKRRSSAGSTPQDSPADQLARSIEAWNATRRAEPLVFALEHHYTQRGLSQDLLKGADRRIGDLVTAAAENANCCVHLAQVSRHLCQFADDGSFERGYGYSGSRGRRSRSSQLTIGETYEDELSATEWTDIKGKKQPLGEIAFDTSAIIASVPLDKWKPTSEEYEGYTGNAGNTLDRWYHRSAIVIWHRDHHFDVLAKSGLEPAIKLSCSMVRKLARTAKKRQEEARNDCVRLSRSIITCWPRRVPGYRDWASGQQASLDAFVDQVLVLSDQQTVTMFLSTLAERDSEQRLDAFIKSVCREFGCNAFAKELKRFFVPPEETARAGVRRTNDVSFRDVQWLSAVCCDTKTDSDQPALRQELCALAVDRFCQPRPARTNDNYYRQETPASTRSLPLLLKAVMTAGADQDLLRVIEFVQSSPEEFHLESAQVPTLKSIMPWATKRFGSASPHLLKWLADVRQERELATATEPQPPADWARPADVHCTCQYCGQLKTFLADPDRETGRIAAREDRRQHVISTIRQHRCDVSHTLERKGSPHSLKLTKTTGSYKEALKRYKTDQKLLASLPQNES